ncbi:MAG: hypothetical protein ACI3XI_08315 [Eubacteriales bacterium]
MKKLTLILLALVTCISLAACAGEGETTTEPEGTVETSDVGETTVAGTDETTEEVFTGYKVTVTDASGNPIAGVQIQMCDSKGCRMPAPTGEDGTVKFNYDESDYHVLIAAAVEGYVVNTSEEYYFENGGKELTIVLEKAS